MRVALIAPLLSFVLSATLGLSPAAAYDPSDPANCNGIGWDDAQPLTVAKVIAQPRVNFVKSPYDDDFKAAGCPAASEACRKRSYLLTRISCWSAGPRANLLA